MAKMGFHIKAGPLMALGLITGVMSLIGKLAKVVWNIFTGWSKKLSKIGYFVEKIK